MKSPSEKEKSEYVYTSMYAYDERLSKLLAYLRAHGIPCEIKFCSSGATMSLGSVACTIRFRREDAENIPVQVTNIGSRRIGPDGINLYLSDDNPEEMMFRLHGDSVSGWVSGESHETLFLLRDIEAIENLIPDAIKAHRVFRGELESHDSYGIVSYYQLTGPDEHRRRLEGKKGP